MTTIAELENWLKKPEGVNLEFKEAKNSFGRDKDLPDYCAALSNENGGKLILGVNNKGDIVGSKAFLGTHHQLSNELLQKIGLRVDVEELFKENKRVLIFHVPPRPFVGALVKSTGNFTYPMRAGSSLTEMDTQTLKRILNENEPDFSAQLIDDFSIHDIDDIAINNFRQRWAQKSKRQDYFTFEKEKVLRSIGLITNNKLCYASLILFGKKEKIDQLLPGSEIIFEWRTDSAKTSHDFRINWREPFFKIHDEIWNTINVRNLRIPFQEGLFLREIYAYNEKAVRESLNNAVTHRNYHIHAKSIFIKASPKEFMIESPGGFPSDITTQNILEKSYWRNRKIAEVFEKAELVERAGQGMNDIFESCIREGKGVPNFKGTDAYSVVLRIPAQIKDKDFILFLERISNEKQINLSFEEIFELEQIREKETSTNIEFREKFLNIGIIERVGKGRGSKYILSHDYYSTFGKTGIHTRLTGLTREEKKALILKHLKKNGKGYYNDFSDVFPSLKRSDIVNLLSELRREKKIKHVGPRKSGYWEITNG